MTPQPVDAGVQSGSESRPELLGRTSKAIHLAPLAFGAFASTTFILSWASTGAINGSAVFDAVATAWVFGGAIQIITAIFEFIDGRLFPAVTFGSFGAFWVSFAFYITLYVGKIPPAQQGAATALFLLPWAVFTLYMFVGSFRTNVAIVIAFFLVECLLIPTIYGDASGNVTALHIGAWAGVVLAVEVWYIAAAEVINHQFGRSLLPLGELVQ